MSRQDNDKQTITFDTEAFAQGVVRAMQQDLKIYAERLGREYPRQPQSPFKEAIRHLINRIYILLASVSSLEDVQQVTEKLNALDKLMDNADFEQDELDAAREEEERLGNDFYQFDQLPPFDKEARVLVHVIEDEKQEAHAYDSLATAELQYGVLVDRCIKLFKQDHIVRVVALPHTHRVQVIGPSYVLPKFLGSSI